MSHYSTTNILPFFDLSEIICLNVISTLDDYLMPNPIYIYIYIYIRGSLNKFPDFFRIGTFIDSTHIKL